MLHFFMAAWAALLVSAASHPAIAYVLVTAAVNAFFDVIKAHERQFAILRIIDAGASFAGVDAVKLTKLIIGLLGGNVPPAPGSGLKAPILPPPLPKPAGLPRMDLSDSELTPTVPSRTTSPFVAWLRLGWLRIAIAAGTVLLLAACGASQVASQESVANYEKLQLECVKSAQTVQEAEQCRCGVKQAYHRPCADAGADGGHDQ